MLLVLLRRSLSPSGSPWGTGLWGLEGATEPPRVRTLLLPFPSGLSVAAVAVSPSPSQAGAQL